VYHNFPSTYYRIIENKDDVVLLETSRYDNDNHRSFLFLDPIDVLRIHTVNDVPELIRAIEKHVQAGHYAAGYFAYECGYSFEQVADLPRSTEPIAWFGIYNHPLIFDHRTGSFQQDSSEVLAFDSNQSPAPEEYSVSNFRLALSREEYCRAIGRIKDYIRAGDTYQINLTTKYTFDFRGSAFGFYRDLKKKQPVPYGAYIRADGRDVLCLSPELFLRLKGNTIVTKPMKGTAPRGRTLEEDRLVSEWLRSDEKNRAENVMIVDLLRNDVGRISEVSSVCVRELFSVERHPTLLQMTSTVEGTLAQDVTYYDVLRSLFPCGSVTGAPKIRSMQIIDELESGCRGVYTGAIGYFSPRDEAVFNVAIRTLIIRGNNGEMGVGSGVVADSVADDEYEECTLKAQFVTASLEEFELLETLLWDNRYPLLDKHLRRLYESAQYFDYPCDMDTLADALIRAGESFQKRTQYKVRIALDRHGATRIEHGVLDQGSSLKSNSVIISDIRTDSGDRFLYHKTTHRGLYDAMHRKAVDDGFADVLFVNEKGQVTEGAVSNIIVRQGVHFFTPPVECGLLNGVYRQHLLETLPALREKALSREDLRETDALYICNAVRGLREVTLCDETPSVLTKRLSTSDAIGPASIR